MNEELNLDLDNIEATADKNLQVTNRFQKLANDNRTLAQEKEEALRAKAETDAKLQALEKETTFLKTFSQLSAKHPEATNYQVQILEKVNGGLSAEDATLLVLAREGKLTQAPPPVRTPSAEGGSAMTQLSDGEKTPDQLTQAEKLSALREMETSGELTQVLRRGINQS